LTYVSIPFRCTISWISLQQEDEGEGALPRRGGGGGGGDAPTDERVFLQPQWLVDVMKALVHHDLKGRLDAVGAGTAEANVTSLGAEFLHTGTLDRRLLVSGCFLPRAK
jgi:hypothetical protein